VTLLEYPPPLEGVAEALRSHSRSSQRASEVHSPSILKLVRRLAFPTSTSSVPALSRVGPPQGPEERRIVEQEKRKQKVLFLCTQNSARSQMAEGFLRHLAGDRFETYSAGIDPTPEIHPCAVEAMSEIGIDISEQYPKGLRTYLGKMGLNYLIIVCARAEERCPKTFPGVG
jgi:Low molecular weight phosphotyrosine protein phosphatase